MRSVDQTVYDDISSKIAAAKGRYAAPSTTHGAKRAKEALQEDPKQMQLIHKLGDEYAVAAHWNQCRNVLLRGWERMSELEEADRFRYSMTFCEATFRAGHFSEASQIFDKVPVPAEDGSDAKVARQRRHLLGCDVMCAACDKQKALKEFCQAISDADFSDALNCLVVVRSGLKKVGIYDSARSIITRVATAEQISELEMMENVADSDDPEENDRKEDNALKKRSLLHRLQIAWGALGLRKRASRLGEISVRICAKVLAIISTLVMLIGRTCRRLK